MEPIILASGSQRRQDYFNLLGLPFDIIKIDIDESFSEKIEPISFARRLATKKVEAVIKLSCKWQNHWVFGADTLVVVDKQVLGKAKDRLSAKLMLELLSDRDHEVITAMALYNRHTQKIDCRVSISTVRFMKLSAQEINWYLNTEEWQGVAGAYRIQGKAACFISYISGSYSSIVGLPLHEFYVMLKDNAYSIFD